jgi:glycosyltransferase involved in cell wall biosynthesis
LVVHDRDARMPRLARQLVARRCQRILAISRFVGDLWTMARPGQTRVVPNGIWVESIARTVPDATSQGRVAMVADFEQWKRHDLFVQAMGRVCARQQDTKALLVGRCRPGCEAWLATVRREIVSLGMQDCCEVRTDVENAWPCIAGARMLVSCATGEPFGRTVVEALAMERPVVAVRGGGPDEILQDCAAGVLVDGRAEEVADAICAAWDWGDDPARRTAARDRAQRFTVDRMAGQVLETYRELAPRWVG